MAATKAAEKRAEVGGNDMEEAQEEVKQEQGKERERALQAHQ